MTDSEPSHRIAEPRELLLAYLDHYRSIVARKLVGLSETDLRTAWLPSGGLDAARELADGTVGE